MEAAVELSCSNLSLSVKVPGRFGRLSQSKKILHNISASFKPGRLTAIMGPSGAGKTALLSVLVGNVSSSSKVVGEILVNGITISSPQMRKVSALVHQDDVLYGTMTVEECVSMSATLRLPQTMPREQKAKRVEEMLQLLGITGAKDTRIGTTERKGVSGGERKRTSIAMELMTDPAVLFLDEPTSGLDTFTAYSVISQLKDIASMGRTIVAAIHQPQSKTFMLFDDLLLLAEGSVIYYGPVSGIIDYMKALGYACPEYMNPADFLFMEILERKEEPTSPTKCDDGFLEVKIGREATISNADLVIAWENSIEKTALLDSLHRSKAEGNLADLFARYPKTHSSFPAQFLLLSKRILRNAIRNPMVLFFQVLQALCIGLLLGLAYYNVPSKTGFVQGHNRLTLLCFICNHSIVSICSNTMFLFNAERPVFLREYHNGYYSIAAYFLSKSLLEVPLALICPSIMITILYGMVRLRPSLSSYLTMIFTTQLASLVGSALGLMLGASSPSFQFIMVIFPMFVLPMMLFGGMLVNLDSIEWYFKPFMWTSPIKWSLSALVQSEMRGLKFNNCLPGELCSGDEAINMYGLENRWDIWQNWCILLLMYIVLTFASFCLLQRMSRQ